ncbi:MAG: heparinase II/III-family protein, partial [Acidobacteriota bacterium]|nr:heparinase II/III-family protein [Acidobacteriota bacterium]
FKVTREAPPELFWLAGAEGVRRYEAMPDAPAAGSQAFREAGTYVLREGDAYLLLNASGAGLGGRGSHAHNDALSVEVSAGGACFVRDPGTYVYTADLRQRHLFRSTAYHSTVEVDGREQNTTRERLPFVIGDEARPRLLRWEDGPSHTLAVAEHEGYRNLPAGAVTHRRSVLFDKAGRFWKIDDALEGRGRHAFRFLFHLAPGAAARVLADGTVEVCDKITGARLFIVPPVGFGAPAFEPRHSSRDYGAREESVAACWATEADAPLAARWLLVPVRAGESPEGRLKILDF